MKNFLFITFFFSNLLCWSQSTEPGWVKYKSDLISVVVADGDGKILQKSPAGDKVKIDFKISSKVLFITYYNTNSNIVRMRFVYLTKVGEIVTAKQDGGSNVSIIDDLESKGSILIGSPEIQNGKSFYLEVNNASRIY